jgi:hypothetical protein
MTMRLEIKAACHEDTWILSDASMVLTRQSTMRVFAASSAWCST